MKKVASLLLLVVLAGCSSFEKSARDSIAAASGVLTLLQTPAQYGDSCKANPLQPVCIDINRAISAENAAIDAAEIYCSGPAFETGGKCQPPSDPALKNAAEAKLAAALANLTPLITHLKGAVK